MPGTVPDTVPRKKRMSSLVLAGVSVSVVCSLILRTRSLRDGSTTIILLQVRDGYKPC